MNKPELVERKHELARRETDTEADLRSTRQRWLADLNLLMVAVIWGVNMPLMKYALGSMDKFLFNAMRLTLSAMVLGICMRWQQASVIDRGPQARPLRQQWLYIVLFSLLTGFAYQVFFLLGINGTSAGNTALIMSSIPMWTAVLAIIFLKEQLSRLAWTGMLIALLGVLIVTMSKHQNLEATGPPSSTFVGNILVSIAAFSWAVGSVLSKPIMKNVSPLALAFYSVALAVPFHYAVAWNSIGEMTAVFRQPKLVMILLYSGIFSTGLAYASWNYGVKHLGASHAAGFQNLVPLIALAASWILISEVPFAMQLGGGALIIVGLAVMRHRRP